MQISKITAADVADFIRLDPDSYKNRMLKAIMEAAKQYILGYTGLTEAEADEKEDLYIAYMVLCQDMYDNRSMYVDRNNVNKVVESVLGMHCKNLI